MSINQTPDVIGKIPDQMATFDEEGNQLTETTYLDGFHINLPKKEEVLKDYLVDPQPKTPYRKYTYGPGVAYKFPDEATFRQFFPLPSDDEQI